MIFFFLNKYHKIITDLLRENAEKRDEIKVYLPITSTRFLADIAVQISSL